MADIVHLLIGDGNSVTDAAVKTSALFLTATVVFRVTARRPVAEFARSIGSLPLRPGRSWVAPRRPPTRHGLLGPRR